MNRVQYRRINVFILGLVAVIAIQFWSYPVFGQADSPVNGFQLIPGVIVTYDRSQAYVMNAEGGIDAIDLSQGTAVWTTKKASKPLGLQGNLLICQVEPSRAGTKLGVVALNIQERGKQVFSKSMRLPAGVTVSIDETLNSSFIVSVQPSGSNAVFSWDYNEHPIQGLIPPDDSENSEMGLRAIPESTTSGSFRMNLTSGKISSLTTEARPFAPAPSALTSVVAKERIAGVTGDQFVSADGRHILSSERIANDAVWEKYRWTIFTRSTGESLGEIKSHVSVSPFFIADSKVIYETTPFLRQTQSGLVEEPAKIRAVDFNTSQELWSKQIRETTFRGPYPP